MRKKSKTQTVKQAAKPLVKMIKAMELEEKEKTLEEIDQLYNLFLERVHSDSDVIDYFKVNSKLSYKIQRLLRFAHNSHFLPKSNTIVRLISKLELEEEPNNPLQE